jgi:thioredoxin reductase (NADPH)
MGVRLYFILGDKLMDELYDIVIVGTGPAGLEAAITAKVRNKNIYVIGEEPGSKKVEKGEFFENYLGLPHISGSDLKQHFIDHLKQMNISIDNRKVNTIYAMGDFFNIQIENDSILAKSVILATGVDFGIPYKGEEALLGKGVSYCATCDGNFFKDEVIAVISSSEQEEKEANYLSEIASKVYYFPLYKEIKSLNDSIEVIREIPKEIVGGSKVEKLVTNSNTYQVSGIFILRNAISPKNLVPGLQMDDKHVIVDREMKTNIPGLFAAGDVVGRPYRAIKSAGEGNIAALSAVDYLDSLKGE